MLLVFALFFFSVNSCTLGPTGSNDALSVTFDDLVKNPSDYFGVLVKITTQMQLVQLDYEGLWIIVQDPDMVTPQVLFVRADEEWFHFPMDLTKKTIVELEGYFNMFSFYNTDQLLTPYTVLELNATTVNLVNEKCNSWINQITIIDLNTTDLNKPSCGAGSVCLKHNEVENLHSTEHAVEILTFIKNCVTLRLKRGDDYEEHILCEGQSAYIPSGTPHMLKNYDQAEGCYIYVWAVVDTHFGH